MDEYYPDPDAEYKRLLEEEGIANGIANRTNSLNSNYRSTSNWLDTIKQD